MKTKIKLINLLTLNGVKSVGEKNLLKSVKELQKNSIKKTSEIFNLAVANSSPIFKLHKIKNKKIKKKKVFKEIPGFIKNKYSRTSLAIKFILYNSKNKGEAFYKKLFKTFLNNAQQNFNILTTKTELQKNVLLKKHFFKYYRWS